MIRQFLSNHTFQNGYSATSLFLPEGSDASYMQPGSRNLLAVGPTIRPWKGLESQGANTGIRTMLTVGDTWGGLADNGFTQGKGSFFQDVARSLWIIGSGIPEIEGTAIGAGIFASINLQVSIRDGGVYSSLTTYEAGLPVPSAPDVGVISTPGLGFTGIINGPVAAKIARLRSATGARSIASTSSAVVTPVNQSVRVTFPSAGDGQDYWRVFFNQPGFGGVGLYYATPYLDSIDVPESLVAAGTIDGIPRSLEFDFVAGDLVPEIAYIDDYPPPAGTNAVRLENVMIVLGCYADATDPVSTSDPGTVGAVSLPNFYESYPPRFLVYFPEQVVDVLSRPTDSYAYVGHKNSITAMQYVGIIDGPAVQVNTITPDIGVPFPHNWCQFQGLLYVYAAQGALWRMTSEGNWDNSFANDIRELIQDLDPEDVVLSTHPKTMSLVLFYPGGSVSWNVQNKKWSPEQFTSDAGVSGVPLSATPSQGDLYVTLNNAGTQTAYKWDEGATEMPVTALTNWTDHTFPASIEELLSTFDVDVADTDKPIIFSVHRNGRLTYVRDASTVNATNTITSVNADWNTYSVGQMVALFGADVGGTGIDFILGTVDSTVGNTIDIVDFADDPVDAQATLSSCYMLIGQFIFTYDVNWTGKQQTPPLLEPYVTDCLSHSLGISIFTNATSGRPFNLVARGTKSAIPSSVIW